eukprot:SAG31_NODE_3287_length_4459_cov_117.198394_1_plen_190_part_10
MGHKDFDVEDMFRQVDNDGSGSISFKEFEPWFLQQDFQYQQRVSNKKPSMKEGDSKLRRAWLGADVDGSGSLDKNELRKVLVEMDVGEERLQELDNIFAQIDTDGSGAIEYKEFKTWFLKQDSVAQDSWQQRAAENLAECETATDAPTMANDIIWHAWLKADADGSGQLDRDELQAVLEAMGHSNIDMDV